MADALRDIAVTELEKRLQTRQALLDITNRIHAAQNIKQILVDLKDGILNLFNAHSITIYVVDRTRNEIYSMFLIGAQVKEIRVPINNRSIAGCGPHRSIALVICCRSNQKYSPSSSASRRISQRSELTGPAITGSVGYSLVGG